MSGWIKFEKDLLSDPRVHRIAKTLSEMWKLYEESSGNEHFSAGNDAPLPAVTLVCGALVRIWVLADTHIGPDNVLPLGKRELDEIIGIEGFCGILPEDWMVEIDEYHVELPDFHAHNGTEAKKKAVTQKRVARHRAKALHGGNGRALPDLDLDQTKTNKDKDIVGQKPDVAHPSKNSELRKTASSVIAFLNEKTGKNFDVNGVNADHVIARLREGATEEECRQVIARKHRDWSGNPEMVTYLRPATLFNRTKFAQYRGELVA